MDLAECGAHNLTMAAARSGSFSFPRQRVCRAMKAARSIDNRTSSAIVVHSTSRRPGSSITASATGVFLRSTYRPRQERRQARLPILGDVFPRLSPRYRARACLPGRLPVARRGGRMRPGRTANLAGSRSGPARVGHHACLPGCEIKAGSVIEPDPASPACRKGTMGRNLRAGGVMPGHWREGIRF